MAKIIGIDNRTLEPYKQALKQSPVMVDIPNITEMSDSQLNKLRVGDVVQKQTGDMKHCYIVTYKEEHHGICLSYFACGYTETVSYDYVDGHWVYNSTDVKEIPDDVKDAPSGTIQDVIGLDSNGDVVKGIIAGGTKLYLHTIAMSYGGITYNGSYTSSGVLYIVTTFSDVLTVDNIYSKCKDDNVISCSLKNQGSGRFINDGQARFYFDHFNWSQSGTGNTPGTSYAQIYCIRFMFSNSGLNTYDSYNRSSSFTFKSDGTFQYTGLSNYSITSMSSFVDTVTEL